MKLTTWIAAGALAVPMISANAFADGKQDNAEHSERSDEMTNVQVVQMSDLPSAVKETAQRETNGKQIKVIKKGTKYGKTVYEIESLSGGKEHEVVISEHGTVMERKSEAVHDD